MDDKDLGSVSSWMNGKPTVLKLGTPTKYGYKCLCGAYLVRDTTLDYAKVLIRPLYRCPDCNKTYCAFTLREAVI